MGLSSEGKSTKKIELCGNGAGAGRRGDQQERDAKIPSLTSSKVLGFYCDNLGYFLTNTIHVVRVKEKQKKKEKNLSLIPAQVGRSEDSFSSSHCIVT